MYLAKQLKIYNWCVGVMEYWVIGKNLEILDKKKRGGNLYFLNLSVLCVFAVKKSLDLFET